MELTRPLPEGENPSHHCIQLRVQDLRTIVVASIWLGCGDYEPGNLWVKNGRLRLPAYSPNMEHWSKVRTHLLQTQSSHGFTFPISLCQNLWSPCPPTREQERFLVQALNLLSFRDILGRCIFWLPFWRLFLNLSSWQYLKCEGDGRGSKLYLRATHSPSYSRSTSCFKFGTKVLLVKAHGVCVNIILLVTWKASNSLPSANSMCQQLQPKFFLDVVLSVMGSPLKLYEMMK